MPNPNLKSKIIYNVSFSSKMVLKVQKSCFRGFSGAPGPHMGGDRILLFFFCKSCLHMSQAIEKWGQNYFLSLILHFSESWRFPIVIHSILYGPITMEKCQLSEKSKIHLKNNFGPSSQQPILELTYVGCVYNKPKNSITTPLGARGPRKPPKTAFLKSRVHYMGKRQIVDFFYFRFGFGILELGKKSY